MLKQRLTVAKCFAAVAFVIALPVLDMRTHLVRKALRKSGGNMTPATERLGMQRPNLYRKIREHGVDPETAP